MKEKIAEKAMKGLEKKGNKLKKEALSKLATAKKKLYVIGVVAVIIVTILQVLTLFSIFAAILQAFQKDKVTLNGYYTLTKNGIQFDKDKLNSEIEEVLSGISGTVQELGFKNEKQAKDYLYEYFTAVDSTFLPYIQGSKVKGLVNIKRTLNSSDTAEATPLHYLWYEDFEKLVNDNSPNATQYFSIDPQFNLCIASYSKTTYNDGTEEYVVNETKIEYQKIVEPYLIPRDLLVGLLLTTKNPEYVLAVSKLINEDGYIDLTILDTTVITTQKEASIYTEHTKWVVEVENDYLTGGGISNSLIENTTVNYIKEHSERNVTKEETMDTTIVEKNMATVGVTAANVWVIKQNTTYFSTDTNNYRYGEEGQEYALEPDFEDEPDGDVGTWKTNMKEYLYEKTFSRNWQKGTTTTDIYADEFLGLWSNETGEYQKGATFVPQKEGGKLVKYKVPLRNKEAPIKNLKGGGMDWLLKLLSTGDDAEGKQKIELLMRYMMKLYELGITKDYSLLGFDLSIFEPGEFFQGGTGSVRETKYSLEEFISIVNNYQPPKAEQQVGYNKYFKAYAEDFYKIATSYNLNPEFIFSFGINESGYGTSRIVKDKNNAFGYGAVDGDAYNSAYTFPSMKEGIEAVCNDIATRFLNPSHWKYQRIVSNGYDPETIEGIGSLYASDGSWANKAKSIMVQIFGYIDNSNDEGYTIPDSAKGNAIVELALKKEGCEYVWGAAGPNKFDCSGFVMWLYKQVYGINLPHSANALKSIGTEVPVSQAKPGDILVRNGHCGIYIGDDKYIHASSPKTGVIISTGAAKNFTHIRRIVGE